MKASFSVTLPCGCEVKHTVAEEQAEGEVISPETLMKFFDYSSKVLAFWYEVRFFKEKRHRCELVSDTNPLGLAPRGT